MAVFAPVDQSGPDNRRKQLIAKLMGQAQSNSAASAPGLSAPAAAGLMGAVGPSFHDQQLASSHPMATQAMNVLSTVMGNLGAMGHAPQPNEASAGHGIAAVPPATPDLHQSAHFVGPAASIGPGPTGFTGFGGLSSTGTPDTTFQADLGSLVALGGGHFYDPTTDMVVNPGMRMNA
jgi:hypothetical protein